MIAELIAALHTSQIDVNADDIADAVWLAMQIAELTNDSIAIEADDSNARDQPDSSSTTTAFPLPEASRANTQPESKPKSNVYQHTSHHDVTSSVGNGIPFRSPAGTALPHALAIGRALRPFMRRVPSRMRFILDEIATAEHLAAERVNQFCSLKQVRNVINPVLSPEPSRWFEVVLVVDASPSMAIWHRTIVELQRLLESHGAFRDVRVWSMVSNGQNRQAQLYTGMGVRRQPRNVRELYDVSGRRIILVISDCVDHSWYNGQIARTLAGWTQRQPVALVQVLPERLWLRSALGIAQAVHLSASAPGIANIHLKSENTWLWLDSDDDQSASAKQVVVPVMTLDAETISSWAKLVTGVGGVWVPGFKLWLDTEEDLFDVLTREINHNAHNLVKQFYLSASPQAYRLAELFAAVPLTLPIMRLVQQTMLPESSQAHLAEVFLSGLLQQSSPYDSAANSETIEYTFLDGVAEELHRSASFADLIAVFQKVSAFVAGRLGQIFDFQAILADPNAIDGLSIHDEMRPYAQIAVTMLGLLGGDFAQSAARLASRLSPSASQDDTSRTSEISQGLSTSTETRTLNELTADESKATSSTPEDPTNEERSSSIPITLQRLFVLPRPPSPPLDFRGRTVELEAIREGLDGSQHIWVYGPLGCGLTSLLLATANMSTTQVFRDGILYVDGSLAPNNLGDFIQFLLNHFYQPIHTETIAQDTIQRALRELRAYIILDDVLLSKADLLKLIELLEGTRIVVGSRDAASPSNMHVVQVEGLPREVAMNLIQTRIDKTKPSPHPILLERLCIILDHLPLPLTLTIEAINTNALLSFEQVVDLLSEMYERSPLVRATWLALQLMYDDDREVLQDLVQLGTVSTTISTLTSVSRFEPWMTRFILSFLSEAGIVSLKDNLVFLSSMSIRRILPSLLEEIKHHLLFNRYKVQSQETTPSKAHSAVTSVEYANFEIAIEPRREDGTFPFSVRSPGGEARGVLRLPTNDPVYQQLARQLQTLSTSERALKQLGELLFRALIDQDRVRDVYARTVGIVDEQASIGLRVTLNIGETVDDGLVGALPWEFLCDPLRGHLSLLDAPMLRYLQQPFRPTLLTGLLPLKVLLTGSHASGEPLQVERELRAIQEALGDLSGQLVVEVEPHITLAKFRQLLRKGFHVWHFVGHGGVDADGAGLLLFEEARSSEDAQEISSSQLNTVLYRSGVQLVLLNACDTAQLVTAPLISLAPALIKAQVPAVIAMQFSVPDRSARVFATDFYRALSEGLPIDACVIEGRRAVSLETSAGCPDWGIPVVYSRVANGKLFDLTAAANASPAPTPPVNQSGNGNINVQGSTINATNATFNTGTMTTTTNAAPADHSPTRTAVDHATDEQVGVQQQRIKVLQDRLQYLQLQEARGAGTASTALDIKDVETQLLAARRQIIDLRGEQLGRLKRIKNPDAAATKFINEVNTELLDEQLTLARAEFRTLNDRLRIQTSAGARERVNTLLEAKSREIRALETRRDTL